MDMNERSCLKSSPEPDLYPLLSCCLVSSSLITLALPGSHPRFSHLQHACSSICLLLRCSGAALDQGEHSYHMQELACGVNMLPESSVLLEFLGSEPGPGQS